MKRSSIPDTITLNACKKMMVIVLDGTNLYVMKFLNQMSGILFVTYIAKFGIAFCFYLLQRGSRLFTTSPAGF